MGDAEARDRRVRGAGFDVDRVGLRALDPAQLLEPQHDAAQAALPHQHVEARAEDAGRQPARVTEREQSRELVAVGGGREGVGGAADAQGGMPGERDAELDAVGEQRDEGVAVGAGDHARASVCAPSAASSFGPRETTSPAPIVNTSSPARNRAGHSRSIASRGPP